MKIRRLCFPGKRQIIIEKVDLSENLSSSQILCRTLYTAISPGTETAIYCKKHIGFKNPHHHYAKYPFYPGYLNVASIDAIGESVKNFSVGQLVFTREPHCSAFIIDLANPTSIILPLPENIDPAQATLAGMASIANMASFMASPTTDQLVVILGLGIIGNFAAQIYCNNNAQVIGIDIAENRLAIAQKCDIQTYLAGTGDEWISYFHKCYGIPHIVVEATGNPVAIETSLRLVGEFGRVVLLGSPREMSILDTYELIHCKAVSLIGAPAWLNPSRIADTRLMLKEIACGRLKVEPLITHYFPFTEAKQAFEAYASGNTQVMATLLYWG